VRLEGLLVASIVAFALVIADYVQTLRSDRQTPHFAPILHPMPLQGPRSREFIGDPPTLTPSRRA
jgi:hypothetical protein